jgi:nitrite reductase/ring-hydroxylating ferredoxin subunit
MLLARQQAAASAAAAARRPSAVARAGFGANSTKKAAAPVKLRRTAGELGGDAEAAAARDARKAKRDTRAAQAAAGKPGAPPKGFPDGWSQLDGTVDELLPAGKATKAVPLKTGRVLVLYRLDGAVYCSDVESPAYRFPMHDAKVFKAGEDGAAASDGEFPAAACPLDGSVFDLRTGAPLVWCPSDGSVMRGALAALKQKSDPSPLLVHPVFVDGAKRVYVKVRAAK